MTYLITLIAMAALAFLLAWSDRNYAHKTQRTTPVDLSLFHAEQTAWFNANFPRI